jgi:DnaJ family protein B protein 6
MKDKRSEDRGEHSRRGSSHWKTRPTTSSSRGGKEEEERKSSLSMEEELDRMDFYEILSILRDSSIEEIKKAYRREALIWHPDKNSHRREEAELRFKKIAEAYNTLVDPQKREKYDNPDVYHEEFEHFSPREAFNLFDLFFGRRQRPFGFGGSMFTNDFFPSDPFFNEDMGFSGFFGGGGSSLFDHVGFPQFHEVPQGTSSFSSKTTVSFGHNGQQGTTTTTTKQYVNGQEIWTQKTVDNRGNIISDAKQIKDYPMSSSSSSSSSHLLRGKRGHF